MKRYWLLAVVLLMPLQASLVVLASIPVSASATAIITSSATSRQSTAVIIRGGGGTAASSSSVESIEIVRVVESRPLWKWLLRLLAVAVVLTAWDAYASVGVPFASAVWDLLYPQKNAQMPDWYYPSRQDVRIATSLLALQEREGTNNSNSGAGSLLLPSETRPALLETVTAISSLLVFIFLKLLGNSTVGVPLSYKSLLPTSATKNKQDGGKQALLALLLDQTNTNTKKLPRNLAVVVRVRQHNTKLAKVFTRVCPLKIQTQTQPQPQQQPQTSSSTKKHHSKRRVSPPYALFQLDKQRTFQWNPKTDKLTLVDNN